MITGWDHVHFVCEDMEGMVKFFADIFGGKETSREEVRGLPMIRMEVHGLTVSFLGTQPHSPMLQPGKGNRGLDHVGFKVANLDQTLEEFKKKGVTLNAGPGVTASGVKYAFINGPEGIRIELIERK
jgi:lactoylglutathione lyase